MLYNVTTDGPLKNRINSKKKSFAAWEIIQYQVFGKTINKWRMRTLHLPRIHGSLTQNSIPKEKIPFSAMWSPTLLPRPKDWPEQCRVVGTCSQKIVKKRSFDPIEAGLGDLVDWLNSGPKPVFIGFGSMVIENPRRLQEMIITAAAKVQCRIVVQSGWTKLDVSGCMKGEDLPLDFGLQGPLCFNVGSCPHDWLLPLCCAAVHHGGAGTTAAGLEYGLPTFICPFFGDQYLWAEAVHRASVGPRFCPVKDLNQDILVNALKELKNCPKIRMNAKKMADAMARENGIQGIMDHFMDFLPVDNMFCDVSMLMGEVRRARYYLPGSNLKVSVEVAALVEMSKDRFTFPMLQWLTEIGAFQMRRYAVTKYRISGGIHNIWDGLYYGFVGLFFQLGIQAPYKLYHLPDKYAYRCGAFGFCLGCLMGPFSMALKILYALLYFVDCISLGIVNGFTSSKNQREYICNRFRRDNSYVYRLANIEMERQKIEAEGIHEERFLVLLNAFEVAVEARRIFNMSDPKENHIHKILEAQVEDLSINVQNMSLRKQEHKDNVIAAISSIGNAKLSFSQFCKILNTVVGEQIVTIVNESKTKVQKVMDLKYWDVYSNNYYEDKNSERVGSQSSDQSICPRMMRTPVVRSARSYLPFKQQKQRKKQDHTEGQPISSLRSRSTSKTAPDWYRRGRSMSQDSVPVRRTRVRTWSDGLAIKIDEFSQTVAGGRVRSKSPKARNADKAML